MKKLKIFQKFKAAKTFQSNFSTSRTLLNEKPTEDPTEPKASFFDRLEKSFDAKRIEMEREAVQKKRITAEQQARAEEFFNQKSLLETRKKLMQESMEGYFSAYYKVANGQEKFTVATKLIPVKLARRMPPLDGTNMNNTPVQLSSLIHQKHATLVLMTFNAFGEKHIQSYCTPFFEKFKDDHRVGLIEYHVNEHTVKSPVVNLLTPYIRWRMDAVRRQRYIPINKNILGFRQAAGITNNAIGWATLVDGSGLIRWQAHGLAKSEEIEALLTFTEKLVGESSRDGGFGNLQKLNSSSPRVANVFKKKLNVA